MAAETPTIPNFDADIAQNITNDLADRANEIRLNYHKSYGNPSEGERLLVEQNRLFMAMLEIRASERTAGRNTDTDLHSRGERPHDPGNIHLDIHLKDNHDGDVDHIFSERGVQIDAGPVRFNTTLAALANSRGLTSLDVLELIGEPTSRDGNYESSHEYMSKLVSELLAAQQHKSQHPEDGLEVDRISWNNARRLIQMRKVMPTVPLRIGMYSKPTDDPYMPERNLVFVYGKDLFVDPSQNNGKTDISTSMSPRDIHYAMIDPQVIIDASGVLNLKRAAVVSSQPHLEEELKIDEDPDRWDWKFPLNEFDFFVLTNEETGALSIFQNLPQAQA